MQTGYNLELGAVVIGVGAYGDWNAHTKHAGGVAYGSKSYGYDVKLGLPFGSNWLPYAKYGSGHSTGTGDLRNVSQDGSNAALGFEYKFASHWSTIGEYKLNKFSGTDGVSIEDKTVTFGLNYYFYEPTEPELEPEPEQPSAPPVTEVFKTFMDERAVRIEGTNFVTGSAELKLVAGRALMKELVEFVIDHPKAYLDVIGYHATVFGACQNGQGISG